MTKTVEGDTSRGDGSCSNFRVLLALPSEILRRILRLYSTGKDLATLQVALWQSCQAEHDDLARRQLPLIGVEKIGDIASLMYEQAVTAASRDESFAANVPLLSEAVAWIRRATAWPTIQDNDGDNEPHDSFFWIRWHSENMVLLDFLQDSLENFSRPALGQFEWPVWCGQICVESFAQGTRLRNTARVLLTAPLQRPSYIPGCHLLRNQTPSSLFRCEVYNMVPVPPWACLRPFSTEDKHVLRPVAERLDALGQVAVPAHFASAADDTLDVRILTATQADRLLLNRSWSPRTDWLVRPTPTAAKEQLEEGSSQRLICCWQDDSTETVDDREYVSYVIDLWKVRRRLSRSYQLSSREYTPT